MLASTLNPLVENGKLKKFSVITASEYVKNQMNGKSFLILIGISVSIAKYVVYYLL